MAVRPRHRPWKVGFVLLVLAAVAVWFVLSMGWQDRLRAVVMEKAAGPVHVEHPAPEEPSQSGLLQAQATANPASTMVSPRLASTVSSTTVPTPILSAAPTADSERTRILIPFRATAPVPTAMPASYLHAGSRTRIAASPATHRGEKQHALGLINAERMKAGIGPLSFGSKNAAQLHAESSLSNCVSGHWGADGLKPYMRYALAGGYQVNGENGTDTAWITV